jgi:hypothetical protein
MSQLRRTPDAGSAEVGKARSDRAQQDVIRAVMSPFEAAAVVWPIEIRECRHIRDHPVRIDGRAQFFAPLAFLGRLSSHPRTIVCSAIRRSEKLWSVSSAACWSAAEPFFRNAAARASISVRF